MEFLEAEHSYEAIKLVEKYKIGEIHPDDVLDYSDAKISEKWEAKAKFMEKIIIS